MNHRYWTLCLILSGWILMQQESRTQGVLDRAVRPLPAPTIDVKVPSVQKAELPDGLRIWLVEDHEVPIIACGLVVFAGSDRDPIAGAGTASMTSSMLQEGTPTRTSLQIAEEIGSIGATLNFSSQTDYASATLNILSKHFNEGVTVLADAITHPTFPVKEFARVQKERLAMLLQQKDRVATVATRAFNRILYGDKHPYGNDPSGTEESIGNMTRDALVRFYENYYRPNNATMIVVGDAKMDTLVPILTKAFADWKRADVASPPTYPTPSVETRKVFLIDKPGAAQSEIRIGYPCLARSTPDFFPVILMNTELGGQFTSRLNANIRERRGFSYGVRSAFIFNRLPGPFVASGGVQTAKTDSALKEFLYEIDLMHTKGITEHELEFAKNRTKGTFAIGIETPSQVASALVNLLVYNLPDDYLTRYIKNVESVTLEDASRVARHYLDSSKMAIVIAGDAKEIRQGIEQLNLGPIIVTDVNGNVEAK